MPVLLVDEYAGRFIFGRLGHKERELNNLGFLKVI
jgi:hypothetical protein